MLTCLTLPGMDPAVRKTLVTCAKAKAFGNRHDVWEWVNQNDDDFYHPLERRHMHELIRLGYIEDANHRVGGGPPGTSVFNDWRLTVEGRKALEEQPEGEPHTPL